MPACAVAASWSTSGSMPTRPAGPEVPQQQPDARQVERYSCGHEVLGAALSTADGDLLDVERREASDVVDPGP